MTKVKKPDVVELIAGIREQLLSLEKKVDLLVSRCPAPSHAQSHQARALPAQAPKPERILYKAICADCNKACEVPFKPSGDRPVYCKECFAKRRSMPARHLPAARPVQPLEAKKEPPAAKKAAPKKKKAAPRKKKK